MFRKALWRAGLSLGALALSATGTTARAETRALLAAVWQYGNPMFQDLEGPANDLPAMEAIVRSQGAKDVTVLRNDQVTRTSVETALHALGLRSKPGDWIVFYYAGHGTEAEAAVKGTADGDYDQFIPLAGFDPDAQDTERFIVDKDFYAWMARYIPPDVMILMIADTCHSGTMNRAVDPAASRFVPRMALRGSRDDFKLVGRPAPRFPSVLPPAAGAVRTIAPVDRADLPNLVFIGAAQDDQLAQESMLPASGAPWRGVLTYAFEQGLRQSPTDSKTATADLDHDGKVSVSEMGVYLDGRVRSLSSQLQKPNTAYVAGEGDAVLFVTPARLKPPAGVALPGLYVTGQGATALSAGGNVPWRLAATRDQADFIWNSDDGQVFWRTGDVVARDVTSPGVLRGVVEKWNAIARLDALMNEKKVRVTVGPKPNGTRYAPGEHVDLALQYDGGAASTAPLYATVFNLASDGTVQTLYPASPQDGEGRLGPDGTLPVVSTAAVAPYGADHVVALVTAQPPTALRTLLASIDNQRLAARVVEPVRQVLAGGGGLSINELFTGP
ncbi:caspase family protein [Novosphingobium colocasiae]|uniref:Peptidase C14 caspase domain-containing protein n=1 Tax=Novosphingobium colocasiae TaxID=1256513 RepID=A0A918UHN7_9SPHN|nr:caspase family protein [Novosphingobium colocasiae]GGZ10178.1 hypothetical protein GCM10011614_26350 [Novosphingobium colocasiae]